MRSLGVIVLALFMVVVIGCDKKSSKSVRSHQGRPSTVPQERSTRQSARCAAGGQLGTMAQLGGPNLPGFVSAAHFELTNMWLARRKGIYIQVYAGAFRSDPSHGVLQLMRVNPNTGLPSKDSRPYSTARKTGRLTIRCVRGNVLFLSSHDGRGTFNLTTHTYGGKLARG
jgi:hypothetical protein